VRWPRQLQHWVCPKGQGIHRTGGSPYKRRTRARVCSYAACVRNSGSVYILRVTFCHVRLHCHSQTAELGDRSDLVLLKAQFHCYDDVMGRWTVLGGVLVAAIWPEMNDTRIWIFRDSSSTRTTLSGIRLPRFFTSSSTHQLSRWENPKLYQLLVKGPLGFDSGTETFYCWWDDHESLGLKLGCLCHKDKTHASSQEGAGIVDTSNKNWPIVGTLSCSCADVDHIDVWNGAIRNATQRSGHV
jgi:hypothetical protein